jgi:hypothetical protein
VDDVEAAGLLADDGQVAGDEQVADPSVFAERAQEVEDLGLDADVQGGDGFVADQQAG